MVVNCIECETHILIHSITLWAILFRTTNHASLQRKGNRLTDAHTTLVAGRVAPADVQGLAGLRLIEADLGVIRLHTVARHGTDAEGHRLHNTLFHDQFVAAGFPSAPNLKRLRGQRTFRSHDKGYVIPARSHSGGQGLNGIAFLNTDTAVRGVMLQRNHIPCHCCRHDTSPEGRCFLLLITDAPALCRMLCTEARRLGFLLLIQHHRRVMCFSPQRTGNFLGHIHPGTALVVEDDPLRSGTYFSCDASEASVRSSTACLSRAFRRISGSSLPRAEALRSIP